LLKKWDFNDSTRNYQKSVRRSEAVSSGSSTFAVPAGSGKSSANRGVAAYAARGSG